MLSEFDSFGFSENRYTAEVFAVIVGWKTVRLHSFELILTQEASASIIRDRAAAFFNWNSERGRYERAIDAMPHRVNLPHGVLLPALDVQLGKEDE